MLSIHPPIMRTRGVIAVCIYIEKSDVLQDVCAVYVYVLYVLYVLYVVCATPLRSGSGLCGEKAPDVSGGHRGDSVAPEEA